MKTIIKYRENGNKKIHSITFQDKGKNRAELDIYIMHQQNRLKGCEANKMLKIESISEVE